MHPWNLTPRQAVGVQRELAARVIHTPMEHPPRFVAGLDAAFSKDGGHCIAGVVLWDVGRGTVVERHAAVSPLTFPYVPGLLSFREAPALLGALEKLEQVPDVLMCDGQGIAHPRRFGIACHLGVLLDLPAVGCAKSRLIGSHLEVPFTRGSFVPLMDEAEHIGDVVRTRDGVRPLFVSVGHRMTPALARTLVLECVLKCRLPEPTRLADKLVAEARTLPEKASVRGR